MLFFDIAALENVHVLHVHVPVVIAHAHRQQYYILTIKILKKVWISRHIFSLHRQKPTTYFDQTSPNRTTLFNKKVRFGGNLANISYRFLRLKREDVIIFFEFWTVYYVTVYVVCTSICEFIEIDLGFSPNSPPPTMSVRQSCYGAVQFMAVPPLYLHNDSFFRVFTRDLLFWHRQLFSVCLSCNRSGISTLVQWLGRYMEVPREL